ncbi:MAG TPA: methyltransferase domain-containing protein [Candidatus Saccharimonadales bacterium]|nr:methyltransferase domain-containing protein [Candidatus Saccharimonadales bacterium]
MLNTVSYYQKRAQEYEKIYQRQIPIRPYEQKKLAKILQLKLQDKNVLEVACGTGYWTEYVSRTALKIHATDFASAMLKIAKTKKYLCPITFSKEDAYKLHFKPKFNGAFAICWFSHIPKQKLGKFLKVFHQNLKKGSTVIFADNVSRSKLGGKLIKKSRDPNTYKERLLEDGTKHLVLKNYYTKTDLINIFRSFDKNVAKKIRFGKYFWTINYEI